MAFLVILVFICTAFVGRVLLQYRLTGDHGLRTNTNNTHNLNSDNNSQTGQQKLPLLLFVTGFSGLGLLSLADIWPILHNLHNWQNAAPANALQTLSWSKFLGLAISALGIVLTSYSQIQMGKNWRIGVNSDEKTDLVTHGIYAISRNPIYLAILIALLGIIMLLPTAAVFICVAMVYLSIDLQIRKVEEPYLETLHGENFQRYKASTNRYFGRISAKN